MLQGHSERIRAPRRARAGFCMAVCVAILIAVCAGVGGAWDSFRRRTQMQADRTVGRIWIAGTTFGLRHQIQRGSSLQKWLNERHITAFGDYEQVQSQYANDRGSVEIWFNYESYLVGQPDLECHRISPTTTAFVDDIGQRYHGFLDIHGKTVGVYLPAFDHSAREMRCDLRWMPRRPAAPIPVSRPMTFSVKLPRVQRLLPPAASVPDRVTMKQYGITATIDSVHVGPANLATGALTPRDLIFHLKIEGGEIANGNMAADLNLTTVDLNMWRDLRRTLGVHAGGAVAVTAPQAQRQILHFTQGLDTRPMSLDDPYGYPMLPLGESVMPIITKDTLNSARRGEGMTWRAPVQNAGKGTDVVRFHFEVLPKPAREGVFTSPPIPFDMDVRVQSVDES
ncbi:MAG TPA: hypothetical protein VKT77_22980 [Chthonomonadaceae bacterium]|nr:hypothetical protein [Chthonomonadaceae bacterium]